MASRQKRKVSASEKGKKKVGSSSGNPLISSLTEEQEARFTKDFQIKIVFNPKYGMLSSFPQECFSFQNYLTTYGLEPLISSFGPYYLDLVRVFFQQFNSPQRQDGDICVGYSNLSNP